MGDTLQALAEPEARITNREIERLEGALLHLEQVEVPLTHRFAPGVYMREVVMPAGAFIIGHEHKTEHLNIVSEGRASVLMDGVVHQIKAPCTFVSKPGVRKVLFIHEDTRWSTIHPTDETDIPTLEDKLIVKSETFEAHQLALEGQKALKQLLAEGDAL
jgi:hypothetical protein